MPQQPMPTREVCLPTEDGVMRGTVAINPGPMHLTGLLKTAYALTDALVAQRAERSRQDGLPITCQPGCGACCRHMVPVSPPEALAIMELIDALDAPRRSAVMARFAEIDALLAQHDMIDRLLDPEIDAEPYLPVAREYFELAQACPFLVDESCSIHPQRPVACRDYNVTSPAARCRRPYDEPVDKLPLPLPLSVPLARATATLTGTRPQLIPLALVPRWAEAHADLKARTWPGLELFDTFLAEMAAVYPPPPSSDETT